MNDATRLRDTVSNGLIALIRHLLTIIALTIMFTINWHLALVYGYTIIVIPVGIAAMRRSNRHRIASGSAETGTSTLIAET